MRFSQVCSNWKTAQTKKPNPNTTKTWDGKHRNFTHPHKERKQLNICREVVVIVVVAPVPTALLQQL